jgi:hypothetical protein
MYEIEPAVVALIGVVSKSVFGGTACIISNRDIEINVRGAMSNEGIDNAVTIGEAFRKGLRVCGTAIGFDYGCDMFSIKAFVRHVLFSPY